VEIAARRLVAKRCEVLSTNDDPLSDFVRKSFLKMIQEDQMNQVKVRTTSKMFRRVAAVAFVAAIGIGATACGDNSVTPQSPNTTPAGPAATTPAAATPGATQPQSGGSGF